MLNRFWMDVQVSAPDHRSSLSDGVLLKSASDVERTSRVCEEAELIQEAKGLFKSHVYVNVVWRQWMARSSELNSRSAETTEKRSLFHLCNPIRRLKLAENPPWSPQSRWIGVKKDRERALASLHGCWN